MRYELRKWWAEQTSRIYRSVLVFLGASTAIVGATEGEGMMVAIGTVTVTYALWWWDRLSG